MSPRKLPRMLLALAWAALGGVLLGPWVMGQNSPLSDPGTAPGLGPPGGRAGRGGPGAGGRGGPNAGGPNGGAYSGATEDLNNPPPGANGPPNGGGFSGGPGGGGRRGGGGGGPGGGFGGPGGGGGRRGGGGGGFGGGGGGRRGGGGFGADNPGFVTENGHHGEEPADLAWTLEPEFAQDAFTFARLEYDSFGGPMANGNYRTGGRWTTDTPDADFDLSFRLHQITSLRVTPGINTFHITPQNLANYPFVYIVEPGRLVFRDEEVTYLRRYLLNGGFLMMDDNWGDNERNNIFEQLGRIFPDRRPVEIGLEHPIFHNIFDLKQKPQMPSIGFFTRRGMYYEDNKPYEQETHDSHFFTISDDKGRVMVFISHNNDFGDGWEREGADLSYFKTFSEPFAYPVFINILFYAMTH